MTINKAPKILIVMPEVTYLPDRMGSLSDCLTAKAGGLADVSASLICELFRQGADVHAAIPNYKTIFGDCLTSYLQKEQTSIQFVFVADRPYQKEFKDIVVLDGLQKMVAVSDFDEQLEHHAYAAADFVLMPSKFEPCGLPQMIGLIYGALPVAHDTGGIHDTVLHLDADSDFGNGFLFDTFDGNGLFWAIDQAMSFFMLPDNVKWMQIERIMRQSIETFNLSLHHWSTGFRLTV